MQYKWKYIFVRCSAYWARCNFCIFYRGHLSRIFGGTEPSCHRYSCKWLKVSLFSYIMYRYEPLTHCPLIQLYHCARIAFQFLLNMLIHRYQHTEWFTKHPSLFYSSIMQLYTKSYLINILAYLLKDHISNSWDTNFCF